METTIPGSRHSRPVLTQDKNNSTSWIGHLQADPNDHFAGQIFVCPSAGSLDNIQLYASAVQQPGQLLLTLYEFDQHFKTWGKTLGSSAVPVEKEDASKWVRFSLPGLDLQQGSAYAFRVQAQEAMIGLGEAATANQQPFSGPEWTADSANQHGRFYSYFNLMFRVELCA